MALPFFPHQISMSNVAQPEGAVSVLVESGAEMKNSESEKKLESRVRLRTILQGHRFAPDLSPDEPQRQHRGVMTLPGRGATVTILRRD